MSDFDQPQARDTSRAAEVASTAQDKAAEGAGLVGGKTAEVAHTAKDQAANTVHEATAQARNVIGELREQLQGQSRAQARQLAGNVRRLADELHEMSENGKPDSTAAAVVRQVADSGRQVASHLESRGPEGVVEDLRDFARRKPGLFLAGAAVAGFAAARLGKGMSAAGSSGGHDSDVGATGRPQATGTLPQIEPEVPVAPAVPAYQPAAVPDQGHIARPEGN
ncbi:hypothetical protein ACIQI8_40845 [Streptomyces sp. NPDC092369]|uniref:hypothetical protein n=1 Tax=Streptomyces sp. NPDC092369 TaxID=3366015 RepID=UPI00381E4B19